MRIEGPYPYRQGWRCRIARESGRVWCPPTDTPGQALRLAELYLAEIAGGAPAKVCGVCRRQYGSDPRIIDEVGRWLVHAMKLISTKPGALAAVVLVVCGLRSSEVVNCAVRDLEEGGEILRIPSGKTRAAARLVAIPESIRLHLIELCAGRGPTEPMFGPRWRGWPRHWATRICKAAGVPTFCAHSMRSLHAALALREEKERLNHAATSPPRARQRRCACGDFSTRRRGRSAT